MLLIWAQIKNLESLFIIFTSTKVFLYCIPKVFLYCLSSANVINTSCIKQYQVIVGKCQNDHSHLSINNSRSVPCISKFKILDLG